ncbi:MAG: amidase [Betaproteobacteria bacterium]
MKALHALGLRGAAAQLAAGTVTSEALVTACAERIHALEPRVMAWQAFDRAGVLEAARAADHDLAASRGAAAADPAAALPWAERGFLYGVPVGVKDIIDVAGYPTGMGSERYASHQPAGSAELVQRMAASGALVMGKTVTTEFAFMQPSRTTNPWNPAHSPGGSSSGSAAAVACGMVPAAIGTQTNGSVIRPAAFCGVVGFKPDRDLISTAGVLAFSPTFDQPGVFARSVADAGLLASWLTRRTGVLGHQIIPARTAPRLAAVRTALWDRVQTAQAQRFAADVELLRAAGAAVDEVELPRAFDDVWKVHRLIMLREAAQLARPMRTLHRDALSDTLNRALDEGEAISDSAYGDAMKARQALLSAFERFLDRGYGAVITVPAAGEAPHGLDSTGDPAFCTPWTLLCTPAITLPTGLGPKGLPLGLQVVGRRGESNYLLAAAAWCEAQLPFKALVAREPA